MAMETPLKIRWVLAHEPIELFLRAAIRFKATMEEVAPGRLEFEIMTCGEYSERYGKGKTVTKHDLLELMESGDIEMSQMYTSTLGRTHNRDMWALDLPFMFRDHGHAQRVLEGEIGQKLMTDMSLNTNVQGLAFTYSGGYRMIPANVVIEKIEDFVGVPLRCNKSPIAAETFRAVGAQPVEIELEEINDAVADGRILGGESTYARYYSLSQNECCKIINDAEHSLFLTSIIVGKDFWSGLDEGLQQMVKEAAFDAARSERKESIEDIDIVKAKCAEDDLKVVTMSEEERLRFKEKTAYVYEKFEDMFSKGLVEGIRAAA